MPEKDPTTYGVITYVLVAALAAWGGLVRFYRKVKLGHARAFNLVDLSGELSTARSPSRRASAP